MMPKEALDVDDGEDQREDRQVCRHPIITQAGVSYVKSEYEAMGEDVDAIQMHYIKIVRCQECLAWHLSPCSVQSAWYSFLPEWQQHSVMI